ncbi:MAG: Ig-like domain-containing protein, partial [Gemmatimonadota bacterium]
MLPRSAAFLRLVFVGLTLACGGDSAGPDKPGAAAAVAAASGGAQTGTVGAVLPQPLVAKVTDAKGRGVPGIAVTFRIDAGNGILSPALDTTDASGQAQSSWTMGTTAAVEQRASAVAAAFSASFTATAQAGPAATLEKITDVGCAIPGAAGARDLIVRVTDTFGNAVSQARVDWAATGGGTVTPATSNTAVDGRATSRWTAGGTEASQSVTATAAPLPAALFAAQLGTSRTLARFEVLTLTNDAMRCNDFAAGGGARYLVTVTN